MTAEPIRTSTTGRKLGRASDAKRAGKLVPRKTGARREPDQEMSISAARTELADVVSRAHYAGRITYLTRRGERLAAIVPVEVAEAIERAEDAVDVAAAREALARIDAGEKPIPLDQLRAELGL
ncbi:type II toxin-antitoxin system Phd/YefM family antitoxin [Catellatospora sp. IY07-71]|uniref:type II toxin-antitoxin system Phd/YefM family antitoxin n=1 Tax=Catellatospora sp. IY07-71 TaxID=2728827 RepID=UPI001FD4B3B6|nr:type II toxin-antitoxin system Phd/YefM family antitoxin [Catellatospora sp. IY07-71]